MPCLGLLCTRCTGTCVELGYHSGCSEIKSSKHKVFPKTLSMCKFSAKHIRQAFVIVSVEEIVANRWACLLATLTGDVRRHNLRWSGIWRTQFFLWVGANEWHFSLKPVSKPKMSHSGGGALRLRVSFLIVVWQILSVVDILSTGSWGWGVWVCLQYWGVGSSINHHQLLWHGD